MHQFLATVNVGNFVTLKLSGNRESNNYSSWKVQMLSLIQTHHLMGFLDGTIPIPSQPPTQTTHVDYINWTTDKVARGWILGAISEPGLLVEVGKLSTAQEVWSDLEKRFQNNEHVAPPTCQSLATVIVANFVTLKLWGNMESNNYASWKVQVLSLIQTHHLMGFIDGSIRIPWKLPTEATYVDKWTTDKVVRGWILGAISEPELLVKSADRTTARKVWLYLEGRFDKQGATRSAKSHNLHKDSLDEKSPLIQAVQNGKWDKAQQLLEGDPDTALIWNCDDNGKIVSLLLEKAAVTPKAILFLKNLLERIPDDKLVGIKNDYSRGTALHSTAAVGNKEAAELLVKKMPDLCYIPKGKYFPIHSAARYKKRTTLEYLISVTRDDMNPNPYAPTSGLQLLMSTIDAEYFDIAIYLVEKYSGLAEERDSSGKTALAYITRSFALSNQSFFGNWERFIASCVPATTTTSMLSNRHNDIETGNRDSNRESGSVFQKLNVVVPKIWEKIAPHHIRTIKDKSRANQQALQLVSLLCNNIKSWTTYETAILLAAKFDVYYVVEAIIDKIPLDPTIQLPAMRSLFQISIENRSEDVFNLIHRRMSGYMYLPFGLKQDTNGNNLLHLAGKLAPSHKLTENSGAALQMQRELQWFKEVEKLIHPSAIEAENEDGKNPRTVFTEEHKSLKEEGEKWMKETANSCTISAALIVTVMFAAAITVPGGNEGSNGYPIFSGNPAFIIFAVSDSISLFASATSLLLFLAILTSRYAEEDFYRELPKRLIFGLATLFMSITFMMVSFGATIFLVFGRQNLWILFPVFILACLPVTSFVLLQFPLMVGLISSTYGQGIFGKKSKRPLY